MRQYLRVTALVVLSYLVQSTVLPYMKINGVIIDVMSIAMFTLGYAMGPYIAVPAGLLSALIMEVVSGDLPGLTTVYCIAAPSLGAWAVWYIPRKTESMRDPRTIRWVAPMLLLALYGAVKELPYWAYFYLTGMDVGWSQIYKSLLSGLIVGALSFLLFPLIRGFLLRRPEDTLLAKWIQRRKAKRKPKSVVKEGEMPAFPAEGGVDA